MTDEQQAILNDISCALDQVAGLAECLASYLSDRSAEIGSAPVSALHGLVALAERAAEQMQRVI